LSASQVVSENAWEWISIATEISYEVPA
jgi:hypothetical protein